MRGKKPNHPSLRRQKGWIGFVRSYKNYVENGNYDKINWGEGTIKPKSVEEYKGKKIYRY